MKSNVSKMKKNETGKTKIYNRHYETEERMMLGYHR